MEENKTNRIEGGYYRTPNRLLDYFIPLVGADGIVLYEIYNRLQNKELGYAFPSKRHLMAVTGFGNERILKANKNLERYGLITIERHWGKSNHYFVHDPNVNDKVFRGLEKLGRKPLVSIGVSDIDTLEDKTLPEKALGQGVSDTDTLDQVYPKQIHSVSDTDTPVYPKQITNNTNIKRQTKNNNNNSIDNYIPEGAETNSQDVVVDEDFNKNSGKEEEADTLAGAIAATLLLEEPDAAIKKAAKKLLDNHDPLYIAEKVKLLSVNLQRSENGVENALGWLVAACRDNYQSHTAEAKPRAGSSKLSKLYQEIESLKLSLQAAIDTPVADFTVEKGVGKERVETKADEKEWTLRDLRRQVERKIESVRALGGKCDNSRQTRKETAILEGLKLIRSHKLALDINAGVEYSGNIISGMGKYYQQFEDYGDLIGFSYEEYQKATKGS